MVWTVLVLKVLVLVFGAQAFIVGRNSLLPSLRGWLEIWNQWDAPHYLDIARDGYAAEGVESRWIVFYPLYPFAVRAVALFLSDHLVSAFFVSTVASLAAGLLLYRLAALDESKRVARGAVFFLFIFPTAFFLHIGYTESLFLALTLGAFVAARRRVWWAAGLLGALAGATRVNGLLLVPALAFEALAERREEGRRWRWAWLWAGGALAGFALYLALNAATLGDPLAFMSAQERFWSKSLTWPWVGLSHAWRAVWTRAPSDAQLVGIQELAFVLLGLVAIVWTWTRQRASYAVWMSANWLLWTSTKFVLSVPRYTLVMFPLFILFARASDESAVWRATITAWSLLYLALFASRFVQGQWAF